VACPNSGRGPAWAKKNIENTAKVAEGRFASANRKDGLCERVWRGTTLLVFSWFFERGGIALFGLDFFVLFNQVKRTKRKSKPQRRKSNCARWGTSCPSRASGHRGFRVQGSGFRVK